MSLPNDTTGAVPLTVTHDVLLLPTQLEAYTHTLPEVKLGPKVTVIEVVPWPAVIVAFEHTLQV